MALFLGRSLWVLLLMFGFAVATVGCEVKVNKGDDKKEDKDEDKDDDDEDEDNKKKKKKKGKGKFSFVHEPPKKNKALAGLKPIMTHNNFTALIKVFNKNIAFPRDAKVVSLECGTPNAFYNSEKHAVILCYEMAALFMELFVKGGSTKEQAVSQTINALTFTFLHEMGHAVIGELDLGVTGGEEDAVDDFATLFLLSAKQAVMAKDGAVAFAAIEKMKGQGKHTPYFDEHSLGEQRFYNILCLIYGSNPDVQKALVGAPLPKSRAVRCPKEFKKKYKAWDTMLKPYER